MSLGIRLNNPGNLRPSGDNWVGMTGIHKTPSNGKFVIFSSMKYGLRAYFINLFNGYFARGLNTISKILEVYAPSKDKNRTDIYIKNVSEWTGFYQNYELCFLQKFEMLALARAMFRQEGTSNAISDTDIEQGYDLAITYLVNLKKIKQYKCYGVELGNVIEPVEITVPAKKNDEQPKEKDFDILEYLKKYWYLGLAPLLLLLLIRKR